MNKFVVKKGLVDGYKIGLQNDSKYIPVPDRNVLSFKKFDGEIEAMTPEGQKMIIRNWKDRIIEESFDDHHGRGKYKIGYFLWKPMTKDDELEMLFKRGILQ